MGGQEQIKRRPNKGGGGGSNDFDGQGLEMLEVPDIDEVLRNLDRDLQNVGGLINATQEKIDRKQRPVRIRGICDC